MASDGASYNHLDVEKKILKFWEDEKIFKVDLKAKKLYSIDTPPPTVSGDMHIGHAFSYSQQDFIARFQRMNGPVFYPFGTDDNGLPTERLVEKLNNVKSKNMSRSDFIELCLKTLKEITPKFVQNWKNLGISADYSASYSTIDENSRRLSQKLFLELLKKEEVYKKEFPTIWCPECQTAIAQAELEDKELPSKFSKIKFKLKGSGEDILIATTRPELIGACVAAFINPKDPRAKKLVGKKLITPIFNEEIEIFADESADLEKGTGILMICSYGDRFDVQAIEKLKLKPKVIINSDGTLNVDPYKGLRIKAARKKILEDLKNSNLIESEAEIKHIVNVHDKCGTEIEFLQTPQWFIKILNKKKKLISNGKKINWYPDHMFKRYENWIKGLEWDWNISRNRHFGIPIPIWECKHCCEFILPKDSELPVDPLEQKKSCPKCKKEATPESMVLDTWATSSISPQINNLISKGNIKLPMSLRPQGHDIIRTWAFYTITRSLLHENEIPWKDIMISGNVSLHGEKMSKSKGNIIDPKSVLEKYGADPLRYWAAGSKLGGDLDYQEQDLVAGKKTITKLWNATKFVFMNLKENIGEKPKKLEKIDDLFLNELNNLIVASTYRFTLYDYSKARSNIDEFFWKNFCDNYLELVKWRTYNGSKAEKESANYTLYKTLLTLLKLYAPIMPFITEEIYQTYFRDIEKEKSIHISKWPIQENKREEAWLKDASYRELCNTLLPKIRQEKTLAKKAMNAEIILALPKEDLAKIGDLVKDLKAVTNAKEIKTGEFKVEFI